MDNADATKIANRGWDEKQSRRRGRATKFRASVQTASGYGVIGPDYETRRDYGRRVKNCPETTSVGTGTQRAIYGDPAERPGGRP